jgi:hypothetical protein
MKTRWSEVKLWSYCKKRNAIDRDERTVEVWRLQRIALERGWSSRLLGALYVYAALRDCQR